MTAKNARRRIFFCELCPKFKVYNSRGGDVTAWRCKSRGRLVGNLFLGKVGTRPKSLDIPNWCPVLNDGESS